MSVIQGPFSNHPRCGKCDDTVKSIDFEFAFQPIVSINRKSVIAHEALARGPAGESALSVLSQVTWENRHRFDQECRARAIESAALLEMSESLSINFIPNAVANPRMCIERTLRTARERGFELSRLIFEVTEGEKVDNAEALVQTFREYRSLGYKPRLTISELDTLG